MARHCRNAGCATSSCPVRIASDGCISIATRLIRGEQLSCLSRGPRMLLHTFCHSWLPPLLIFDHRIENRQQFAPTRGQGHFFRFAHHPLVCNLYPLARHDDKIGRISAKPTSYRIDFDVFSLNCKKPRLILCRRIDEMRHDRLYPNFDCKIL